MIDFIAHGNHFYHTKLKPLYNEKHNQSFSTSCIGFITKQ